MTTRGRTARGGRAYPRLAPHTPILRRGRQQLQLGVDSQRTVVLDGVGPQTELVLRMLDGCHHIDSIRDSCDAASVDPESVDHLLRLLDAAGLVEDAGGGVGRPDHAPETSRVRLVGAGPLGTQVARLLVASGVAALAVFDSAVVDHQVHPTAGVLATNAEALAATMAAVQRTGLPGCRVSVLNHWSKPDGHMPDVTVVAADQWEPDRVVGYGLVRADQPHLFVRQAGPTAVVGPFVVPGQTACLDCTDLVRSSTDRAWPLLLTQLSRLTPTLRPALSGWAASTAVVEVLRFLSGAAPSSQGHTLELSEPDYAVQRRPWPAHPSCGCSWPMTAQWSP
jgi:hypothetical protein